MKMREIAEEIYEVILHDKEKEVGEMRVHIVKGKPGKRSLMVDTGFGSQESLEDMEEALAALDISYKDLDIFLTHKHHDHCGLASTFAKKGAKIFMNPAQYLGWKRNAILMTACICKWERNPRKSRKKC